MLKKGDNFLLLFVFIPGWSQVLSSLLNLSWCFVISSIHLYDIRRSSPLSTAFLCLAFPLMDRIENDVYRAICECNLRELDQYLRAELGVNHVFSSARKQDIHGMTLLGVAVKEQVTEVVKFLLEESCDVNKACIVVGSTGKSSKVRAKRHKDCLHLTPLYTAICYKNAEVTQLLVSAGADVNFYDQSCCSALWHAVDTNNIQIVDAVLSSPDCAINDHDLFKISPLNVSSIHCNSQILQRLLDRGAVVDNPQIQGRTPLFTACASGSLDNAKLLLQHGSDPNFMDMDGLTPLSCALESNKGLGGKIVQCLLYAGAAVHTTNLLGFQETKYSRFYEKHPELAETLVEHLDMPVCLKAQSALKIKRLIRENVQGRSIYSELTLLPLPKPLKDYLQLNNFD